jgi:serine/threonine-protein kinase
VPLSRLIVVGAALLALAASCAAPPESDTPSPDPEATWERNIGLATRSSQSTRKGDLVIAESYYRRALEAAQSFPEDDPRRLETRYALARLHRSQGRAKQAARELEALVPDQQRAHGESSAPVAATLHTLCHARNDAGRYRAARRACLKALEMERATPGTGEATLAATELLLARAELGLRNLDEAASLYRGVLERVPQGRRPVAVVVVEVQARNGLARVRTAQRRHADAETLQLKALSLLVRSRARRSPEYATVTRDLGDLYVQTRRYEEARQRYDRALVLFEELKGKDHFEVRDTMLRIADLLARTGQPRAAAELRYKAEAIPDPRR